MTKGLQVPENELQEIYKDITSSIQYTVTNCLCEC